MMERLESYTNIAYFLSGLAGYIVSGSVVFLIVMTVLSAGSFIYHKHKIGEVYKFDWVTIVVAILGIAGILLDSYFFWIGIAIYITIYSYFLVGSTNVYLEIGLSCIPLIVALFITKPFYEAIGIIVIFLIALWIRKKDNHKNTSEIYYDSRWHSLWHLMTAVGFYLII